jgi:hypothetical protein
MADAQVGVGEVRGNEAHDAIDAGNPVKTGGRARATAITAVASDDRVDAIYSTTGGQLVAGSNGGAPTNVAVDASGNVQVDVVSSALPTGAATSANQLASGHDVTPLGNVAHDAADAGNPVKIGGKAFAPATPQTSVAANDRVNAAFDLEGRQWVQLQAGATPAASEPIKLEDGAHTSGDAGMHVLGVRRDVDTSPVGTDGDYHSMTFDANGQLKVSARGCVGNIAHDAADSGNPIKIGFKAVEFNSDPPTVSADDDRSDGVSTPQGMQWVLGGYPKIINREYMTTAAQTNDAIIDTVAVGSQIIVTSIEALVDNSTSVDVSCRIGFGASAVPTEPTSGATVDGMVLSHPGIAGGSGVAKGDGGAAIAIGGDGEELRITNSVPTGGKLTIVLSYYVSTL